MGRKGYSQEHTEGGHIVFRQRVWGELGEGGGGVSLNEGQQRHNKFREGSGTPLSSNNPKHCNKTARRERKSEGGN